MGVFEGAGCHRSGDGDAMKTLRCRKCGKAKHPMYFYGAHRVCKECMREASRTRKLPKGLVTL